MKWALGIPILAMITTVNALADSRSITFFSDGARVEIEATATKGVIKVPLPMGILDNSLRVKPVGSATIQRVDLLPMGPEAKGEREQDSLLERKSRLEDRLQALKTREEIFKSAAKSQGSKAPRKTKANPDPMQTIRQGTDFAIAQLEAVYTAQRKTTREIHTLDARIAGLRMAGAGAETMSRIHVAPHNGRVMISYALLGQTWKPCYDIRINDHGKAVVTLLGQLPAPFTGYLLRAAPTEIANSAAIRSSTVTPGSLASLAQFILPLEELRFGNGPATSFSARMSNTSAVHLPSGEASLYYNGEYRGRVRFEGLSSGRSRRISSGG